MDTDEFYKDDSAYQAFQVDQALLRFWVEHNLTDKMPLKLISLQSA